ncbi:MAG TPA: tetratricopeptide repeat protein [Burkholderiales bacterium]|nr:tetratricopeptide repeat protein [Burkholderiales bacterium]
MIAPIRGIFVLTLIGIVAIAAAYGPGLSGPFVFDDEINIAANPRVTGAVHDDSLPTAPPGRLLSVASFALNAWISGSIKDPFPFKLTNLLIHLLNALLIGYLIWLLTGGAVKNKRTGDTAYRYWTSFAVALAWALHPLQLTSVLYVVQRMTSLATLFILLGLVGYTHGRRRIERNQQHGTTILCVSLIGGTLIGFLAKENAVLLALYALVVEFVFFRDGWKKSTTRRQLYTAYGSAAIAVLLLALTWLLTRDESLLGNYSLRAFTLAERLLTEPRILWFYLGLLVFPDIRRLSLFHDDIAISASLWQPWTTLTAILGLMLAIVAAVRYRDRAPLLCFAVLWFVVGHSLESSFIGLEIAHEHRNYLPSLGPIAAVIIGLSRAMVKYGSSNLAIGTFAAVIACLGFVTHARAGIWASEQTLLRHTIAHHPDSERANAMLADFHYLREGEPLPAMHHYLVAADIAPYETAYLIRVVQIASQTGMAQRRPGSKIAEIRGRGKTAMLLMFRYTDGSVYLRPTAALDALISQRLQSQPVHARTAQALRELTRCVVSKPACRYLLPTAIQWHEFAVASTRTNHRIRLPLLMQLVQLHMERGMLADARAVARQARALEPQHPVLALMYANVELLAGNTAEAEQLLREVQQHRNAITEEQWREAEKLIEALKARRER